INWWLSRKISNKIIGLELDPIVAADTRQRLSSYHNVTIISGDAIENFPADGTIFYLYNPFNEQVLQRFKEKILNLRAGNVRLFYYNCKHAVVFEEDPRFQVERRTLVPEYCFPPLMVVR